MTDRHSNHTIHSVSHHFGWDNSNKPILQVRSGTIIEIETLDSSGEQLNINSTSLVKDLKIKTHYLLKSETRPDPLRLPGLV